MIAVNVAGKNCWLITAQPGDDSPLKLTVRMPLEIGRSLKGAVARRPVGISPRYALEFRALVTQKEYAVLRAASISASNDPILAPIWPHMWRPGIDVKTMDAGLIVAFTANFASHAINPGSYAGYTYAVPLLYGHFKAPPKMGSISDGLISADFSLEEDSQLSYSFNPTSGILAADGYFTAATGYAAPFFPFIADWESPPQPAIAFVEAQRSTVGNGRQKSTEYFPQNAEQIQSATFVSVGATEAACALAWWIRRGGEAGEHYVATNAALWHLAANATAGASNITLALDTLAPIAGASLAIQAGAVEFVRVLSVSGAVVTLAAPLTKSWDKGSARVMPAMLARHTNSALELNYYPAGALAEYRLNWREVSAEYAVSGSETRGVTIGQKKATAWLYKIDLDYNGAIATTRLTDWESGATVGGFTWVYNPCEFSGLVQSDDLEDDSCTFQMRWFAGCPWENWQPGILAARGYLTIYRADSDVIGTLSGFAQVWKGELSTPTPEGANLSVKVLGANALFARTAPRQNMSLSCGTMFTTARCGLLLSDWKFDGTVVSVSGNAVTIGSIARANGGGLPSGFAVTNWFSLGFIGWTASGLPQREGILISTAISGGQITLTLDRPSTLTNGTSVYAVPGCDRQSASCLNKFANLANNRGFPFMPAVSPNFIIPQQQSTKAKK